MTGLNRRNLLKCLGLGLGSFTLAGQPMFSIAAPDNAYVKRGDLPTTLSEKIAKFIVNAKFEDLPPAVVEKAKAQIIYHFGLAFSGSFNIEAEQMRRVARQISVPEGAGGATVIGECLRLYPSDAAFANTTLMRAIWRDDVVFPAGVHPGMITLPTALAVGEVKRRSGKEVLLAVALAYEVLGKLGSAAYGWSAPMPRRPNMIYGGYAPVTAAGRLLNLDEACMANALGFAANLGMGVPDRGQTDHFYSLISRKGLFAAQLAEAGAVTYGRTTIEGDYGLYRSFFGQVPANLEYLIDRLGHDWEILRAEYKRHHGTGQNTVAIELLSVMAKDHQLSAGQVAGVDVFLSEARKGRRENAFNGPFNIPSQAYSSMPYALSLMLIDGKVTPEQYTGKAIRRESVNAMAGNITMNYEPGHEVDRYCRLEVRTRDGRKIVRDSSHFMFPFPRRDWGGWLRKDGKRLLSDTQLERLEGYITDLEDLDDVSRLMRTVVPTCHNNQ